MFLQRSRGFVKHVSRHSLESAPCAPRIRKAKALTTFHDSITAALNLCTGNDSSLRAAAVEAKATM